MPKNPVDPEVLRWRRELAMATKLFSAYTRAMHLRLQNFKPKGNPEQLVRANPNRVTSSYGIEWRVEVTDRYHWVPDGDCTAPHHLAPKKKIRPPGGERIWFNGYYWKSIPDMSKRKCKWVLNTPLDRMSNGTVIDVKPAAAAALFQRINDAAMCFREYLRNHCERDELLRELLKMRSSAKSDDLNAELSKRVRPMIHERNFIRVLKALGNKTRGSLKAPRPMSRADVDEVDEVDDVDVRKSKLTAPVRRPGMKAASTSMTPVRRPAMKAASTSMTGMTLPDALTEDEDENMSDVEQPQYYDAMLVDAIAVAEHELLNIDNGLQALYIQTTGQQPDSWQPTKVTFNPNEDTFHIPQRK